MLTGVIFVLLGLAIWFYPQILVAMVSAVLILFGLGIMATSWQFRRFKRQSASPFINWIIRW